jgi:hypothetical protein
MKTTVNDFDTFFEHFLICALWSSIDDEGEPMDKHHSITDIDPDCLQRLKAHALSFWTRCWYYLDHEDPAPRNVVQKAGHDFWLTSQGHGCGFWDGGWPKYGDMLTKLSECYPPEMQILFTEEGKRA